METSIKKIAFITPSLQMGGAERWILTLVKNFKKVNPYLILCLSSNLDQDLFKEACDLTSVVCSNFRKNPENIKDFLKNADVVISWAYTLDYNLAKKLTCPVVDVSHSDPAWEDHARIIKKTSQNATHYVGVSQTASLAFNPELKPTTIYNGVDVNRIKPFITRAEQQTLWKIRNKKIVLFIGRLSQEKNPLLVVEAANHLEDDWVVLFVESGQMIDEMKKFESEKIRFIPKTMHVGNYYLGADVIVMPSKVEGMPLVLIESWLSGIPTVTTQYAAYKEFTENHGDLSWSIPVNGSGEQLARSIKEAYDSGRKSERVLKAKEIALSKYTAPTMASNWENYIFNLVGNDNKS